MKSFWEQSGDENYTISLKFGHGLKCRKSTELAALLTTLPKSKDVRKFFLKLFHTFVKQKSLKH